MGFTLEDSKGRTLLAVNDNGQFAFSRFSDMSLDDRNKLREIYISLSDDDISDFDKFLDFKDVEFCS